LDIVNLVSRSFYSSFCIHLISTVRGSLGGDSSIVSHLRLVDDKLTLALTKILDLQTFVGNNQLAIDEKLNW
jgi:hypothetical protein